MENFSLETSDLSLAAYLLARGCRFDGAYGFPRLTFRLKAGEDIDALSQEFLNDGAVGIQRFLQNQKMLRSLVTNHFRNRG